MAQADGSASDTPGADPSKGADSGVRSVDRALSILEAFTQERPRMGVLELSRLVSLSPSTTHRIVSALTQRGFLTQANAGGDYALGQTILKIALVAESAVDLAWLARDTLTRLRDEADETAAIHVFEPPSSRVTLAQQEGLQPLRRSYTDLGKPIPLHQGASSLALLAYLPSDVVDDVLGGPLPAAAPHTMTDPDTIRAELERIRERGYAMSIEGRVTGVSSVAAPVFNHASHAVAALSVSGPSTRLTELRLLALAEVVRAHARELSERMGYRAP